MRRPRTAGPGGPRGIPMSRSGPPESDQDRDRPVDSRHRESPSRRECASARSLQPSARWHGAVGRVGVRWSGRLPHRTAKTDSRSPSGRVGPPADKGGEGRLACRTAVGIQTAGTLSYLLRRVHRGLASEEGALPMVRSGPARPETRQQPRLVARPGVKQPSPALKIRPRADNRSASAWRWPAR